VKEDKLRDVRRCNPPAFGTPSLTPPLIPLFAKEGEGGVLLLQCGVTTGMEGLGER